MDPRRAIHIHFKLPGDARVIEVVLRETGVGDTECAPPGLQDKIKLLKKWGGGGG